MIGDLISILLLSAILWRIIKLKKTDFSRFLPEAVVYFLAFVFALVFYRLFFGIDQFFFPEELYPSMVGIFAASFVSIYLLLKFAIFLANKKRPELRIEDRISNVSVGVLDFINPTTKDFDKFFFVFLLINLIIIGSLLNSLADAFSFKKRLYVGGEFRPELVAKEKTILGNISGNDNFKYNITKAIEFIRLTNPHYYAQVIENADRINMSDTSLSMALALANPNNYSIVFDSKYGQKRYDSIKDYLGVATILVHESQHLKDFRMIDRGEGFNFFAYIGGGTYFKIVCNPITNYENFTQVFRAAEETTFDEWCAQIEEVKFMRMYNVDYKNFNEFREVFSK